MSRLRKDGFLSFRTSPEQLDRLGLAACLASRQRHEEVDEGPLARQFMNHGVDALISAATPAELAEAEGDLAERRRREADRREALKKERLEQSA